MQTRHKEYTISSTGLIRETPGVAGSETRTATPSLLFGNILCNFGRKEIRRSYRLPPRIPQQAKTLLQEEKPLRLYLRNPARQFPLFLPRSLLRSLFPTRKRSFGFCITYTAFVWGLEFL